MLPYRYTPSSPEAFGMYIRTFGAAGNMKVNPHDFRAGMVFNRMKVSQVDDSKVANNVHISLAGQWSPTASTFTSDYLHPAFFNSLYSHVVSSVDCRLCTTCVCSSGLSPTLLIAWAIFTLEAL